MYDFTEIVLFLGTNTIFPYFFANEYMFLGLLLLMLIVSVLMLVFNYQKNNNTIFLSLFFIIFFLYGITHYVVTEPKSVFWGAILYINFTPLYLLLGPMLYFYLRNTLGDKFIFNKKDLIHFIPALILFIGQFSYLISDFNYKKSVLEQLYQNDQDVLNFQSNIFFSPTQNFFIRLGLLIGYISYNLYLLFQYKKGSYKKALLPKTKKKITFQWLLLLNLLMMASVISYFYFVLQITLKPQELNIALSSNMLYSSAFFLMLLILSLLAFPDILYGFPQRQETLNAIIDIKNIRKENSLKEAENFFLDPSEHMYYKELQARITDYLDKEEPYLAKDFKMLDLVKYIGVPQHHISYCLRYFVKKTLPQIKTEYRIKWAAHALKSIKYSSYTVDAIAEKSGYQSKSAFYNSFNEVYGITPFEYKKLHSYS